MVQTEAEVLTPLPYQFQKRLQLSFPPPLHLAEDHLPHVS